MKSFSVAQEKFSGPFDLLLELLEKQELKITDISLAHITEDYFHFLESHEVPASELGDFLVVACQLLWLKSKAILPILVKDEPEGPSLADQLRAYQLFLTAAEKIEMLYNNQTLSFGRAKPLFIPSLQPSFPLRVTPKSIHTVFLSLLKRLRPFFALEQASLQRVVSVQERMEELRELLLMRSTCSFSLLLAQTSNRLEVIVSFLAVLELAKQRVLHITQSALFEDITIKHIK